MVERRVPDANAAVERPGGCFCGAVRYGAAGEPDSPAAARRRRGEERRR